MDIIKPKNWSDFQHYKDRVPPWIKLHKSILDNYDFHMLPVASKALAPCLWLLSSEDLEGKIVLDYDVIAFRFRMKPNEVKTAIKPLIDKGFYILEQDASSVLAKRSSETETETEGQKKQRRFTPPPIEQIREFAIEKGYKDSSFPDRFFSYYESVGWKVGKNKMRCWKSAARGWIARDNTNKSSSDAAQGSLSDFSRPML